MHSYRFSASCLFVTLLAVALLAFSAQGVWDDFLRIAKFYGSVVVPLVVCFFMVNFLLWIIYRIYTKRGSTVSQAERLGWYSGYFSEYPWLNVLVATTSLVTTLASFTAFKATVVGANGYGFDPLFTAWDRLFFAGNDGWIVTHSIFDTAAATAWIDHLYHPTFFPMLLVYLISIASTGLSALRQTYMLAYLTSFLVIGMLGANMLHSAGPVFDGTLYGDGSTFGPLLERLQMQLDEGGGPVSAAPIREYLLRTYESREVENGTGISAMPSMHMVLVFLCVFPAWNLNHIFGIITALYAGIIWVGSVHLGWHYFVDGLVSLVIVGVIWRISGHIVGLYGPRQTMRTFT